MFDHASGFQLYNCEHKINNLKTCNVCHCACSSLMVAQFNRLLRRLGHPPAGSRWGSAKTTAWHPTFWHATTTTCSLIHLHHNRVYNAFQFLLLCFKFIFFSELILVKPIKGILHSLFNFFLVTTFKLLFELLLIESVAHCEAIVFQTIFCFDLLLVGFVLGSEFFCLLHHAFDLSLRQAPFFIGDCNLV